jgi:predicted transcriptional regulator
MFGRYLSTLPASISKLATMDVHLRPEIESRLQEFAAKTGRAPDDLIEDAMSGYLQELAQTREMLDSRNDDLKRGRVKPVDGEEAFAKLRRKSEDRRAGS